MRTIALLLLLSLPVLAQTPAGVWGERGVSRRFALRGDLLYAADGRGVSVYDVSNPANIRRIDIESGDAESFDVALIGTTDLVLATSAGIDRFAVNADGTLTRLGWYEVEGGVTRVAATGSRVAAANGKTLLILSRSGDALSLEQQKPFSEAIRALVASGSTVYAAVERTAIFGIDTNSGETLSTVNVDALGLAVSGSTLWAAADVRGLYAIDLNSSTIAGVTADRTIRYTDVAAAGSRVYAVQGPDRLHVFDGSKPSEPKLLGSMTEWVNVIAASGTRVFVSGATVDSERLTFETGLPVRVFETATATTPVTLGEFRDLAGPVSGVWTDGSLAYVIDAPYLRVLDVSKTAMPREIRSILVPDIQDWIRVRNGLAINYGRTKVNLIDVTKPLQPVVIGSWDTQGHAPSFASLARDTVVEANNHSGLHVVDYSTPSEPVQISGRIFHYLDVASGDDAIYTIQHSIFLTADITDRRNVVDRTMHSGQFFRLDTLPPNSANPHHVVVSSATALHVYDLTRDRFSPRLIAAVPMSQPGILGTNDTTVFVSKDGILKTLDVASPAGFAETDMVVTSPMQISVAGQKVVVADRYRLRIYGPDTAPPPEEPPVEPPAGPSKRRVVRH